MRKSILTMSLLLLAASPAHAYIGPGAGAGTIAVVLGVIASLFLALVAIVWYPLKRLYLRLRVWISKGTGIQSDLE